MLFLGSAEAPLSAHINYLAIPALWLVLKFVKQSRVMMQGFSGNPVHHTNRTISGRKFWSTAVSVLRVLFSGFRLVCTKMLVFQGESKEQKHIHQRAFQVFCLHQYRSIDCSSLQKSRGNSREYKRGKCGYQKAEATPQLLWLADVGCYGWLMLLWLAWCDPLWPRHLQHTWNSKHKLSLIQLGVKWWKPFLSRGLWWGPPFNLR